jgi:hypothetical protein
MLDKFRSRQALSLSLLLLTLAGAAQAIRAFAALFTPLVLDYTEMMLTGGSWQLQHNGLAAAYLPPDTPYHLPGIQYPPLFPLLMSLLNWLIGVSLVGASRFWSYGSYVAAAIMVVLLVRQFITQKLGKQKLPALPLFLSLFLPFCFWPVIIFAHTARVDPLALFFSLLGVWLYLNYGSASSYRRLVLVAAVLVLAVYTKQTYIVAPAAVFFHLLFTLPGKARLKAFAFGFTYAGFLAGGYLLIALFSNTAFLTIFDPARAARFILNYAPGMIAFFTLDHLPLLLIAVTVAGWQWRQGYRFYPIYLLLSALSCITIVKDGAIDYYFTELAYIICIQVGIAATYFYITYPRTVIKGSFEIGNVATYPQTTKISQPPQKYLRGLVVALFVQGLIAIGMFAGWGQQKAADNFRDSWNSAVSTVAQAQQQNRAALILTNGLLIATGQYEKIGDYLIYSILLSGGKSDPQLLANDLTSQRWQLIITTDPPFYRWPESISSALSKHYNLNILSGRDGTNIYWVYTPN